MNEQPPAEQAAPATRRGPALWLFGGVMWLALFATLGVLLFRGGWAGPASPDTATSAATAAGVVKTGGAPAESPWDEDGLPAFTFTDSTGEPLSKEDLEGTPWVAGFIFTTCAGPCPKVTAAMAKLQKALPDEVKLITFTVLPEIDTPEVLANYAKFWGAEADRWHFLTGDKREIYTLIDRGFKMPVQEVTGPERQPGYEVVHTTNLMLVDADGVVRGKFNSQVPAEVAALTRAAKMSAAETDGDG